MSKYRRIEINAYHRKVTVVSGEWRSGDVFEAQPVQTDDEVTVDDSDVYEALEPDSPEGQMILVEAVRSLEQRLTPETRASICAVQNTRAPKAANLNGFYLKLQSLFQSVWPRALRLARKEK